MSPEHFGITELQIDWSWSAALEII